MPRKLIAELILDPSQYIRGLKKAELASKQFHSSQQKAFGAAARGAGSRLGVFGGLAGGFAGGSAAFAAGAAGATVVSGLEKSVQAASDLNEQMSKTTVVFGQASAGVKEWATTTSQGFGIAQREALQTVSSFGALFAPVGLIGQKSAEQSEKLTELGADLASFYNTDVQQALDAIKSGLVGEERPLRDYGVRLSAARVEQEALVETGKKHVKQLTDLDKTMARIQIIFQDTTQAQGDYARTSEGLANQTRTLKANIDNLSTTVGEALIPAVTDATGSMNDFFAALANPETSTNDFATAIDGIIAAIKKLGDAKRQHDKIWGLGKLGGNIIDSLLWGPRALAHAVALNARYFQQRAQAGQPATTFGEQQFEAMNKGIVGMARSAALAQQAATGGKTGPTAQQRNTWFDNMIGRLQLRAGLLTDAGAQIAAYQKIAALLKQQIAKIHDVTRQLNLKDQALQVAAQIAALVKQQQQQAIEDMVGGADIALLQAQLTKSLADDLAALEQQRQLILKAIKKYGETKDLRLKLIQNQIDTQSVRQQQAQAAQQAAEQARQEKVGWMEFAYQRAQSTKTIADDIKTATILLNYWKKQAATGKRTLEEAQNVFHWQQELKNLRKGQTDPLAGLMQVSSRQLANILAAGTGLTAAGRRQLQFNIAGTEIQPVHVHVNLDGREVASAVAKEQARSGVRTAKQTSGRRG